ncbi:MAG: hypothetical protein HFE98_03930 [Ruminiclostridium sp.]|nr:hypothetical protein [Ruminiclostridium sp.]
MSPEMEMILIIALASGNVVQLVLGRLLRQELLEQKKQNSRLLHTLDTHLQMQNLDLQAYRSAFRCAQQPTKKPPIQQRKEKT